MGRLENRTSFKGLLLIVFYSLTSSEVYRQFVTWRMRAKGFFGTAARDWIAAINADRTSGDQTYSLSQRDQAYGWGYLPADVSLRGITQENHADQVSREEYAFLYPLNGKYDKWLEDRAAALKVFQNWKERLEPAHYHIIVRDGAPFIIALTPQAKAKEPTIAGLYEFLREQGSLLLTSARWSEVNCWTLEAVDEGFALDGIPFDEDQLMQWMYLFMREQDDALMVVDSLTASEGFQDQASGGQVTLRAIMVNQDGAHPRLEQALLCASYAAADGREALVVDRKRLPGKMDPGIRCNLPLGIWKTPVARDCYWSVVDVDTGCYQGVIAEREGSVVHLDRIPSASELFAGVVSDLPQIKELLESLCRFVPQIEMASFDIRWNPQGFCIVSANPFPDYVSLVPFAPGIQDFLSLRLREKHQVCADPARRHELSRVTFKLKVRKLFALAVGPKGLVPYLSTFWIRDMYRDLVSRNGISLKDKLWAYDHGFLSYRLPQYGITRENWKGFISDFEYRYLRHINTRYRYWLEDKITLKYIAADFKECFPAYYYYITVKDGQNRVIPMMDAPEGYGDNASDVLRLARELGQLALKPDEGSHGEGFYKLSWDGSQYLLNGTPANEERILGILEDPENQYLVTEYIQMHPQMARLYPGSVNTIRVTVFKQDGRTPQIGNVYMRVGSSLTGVVDNVAAGGIVAEVDIATGRYGNAQRLDGIHQGNLVSCAVHPDTGVPIEGVLPNWDQAKEQVLAIAAAIPQLEYFGFDLALTPDGIKLPEINRFPDFPRVDKLTPEITEYLLYKLKRKKRVNGYAKKPCRKLLHLPQR